jgi:hypothetical protein
MGGFVNEVGLPDKPTPSQQRAIAEGNEEFAKGYGADSMAEYDMAEYGKEQSIIDTWPKEERGKLIANNIGSGGFVERKYQRLQKKLGHQIAQLERLERRKK